MALPVINSSPQYELVIPSTGQKVEFRPYLVKEEKVLMVAFESGDQKQATKAIGNTLNACITTDDVDVFELTTYDIEYLFTQIRTKSVGETSRVVIPCTSCEHKNDVAKARAEFEERRGADFNYRPLLGNRPPALDYRN